MIGRMFAMPDEDIETLHRVRNMVLDTLDALREVKDIFAGHDEARDQGQRTELDPSCLKEFNTGGRVFEIPEGEVEKFEMARSMALDIHYALREIKTILTGCPYDEGQTKPQPIPSC